jgi:hypothetical protein
MKRIIIYTIALLATFSVLASPTSAERWEAGNKSYIEGNFDKAVEEYNAILDGGVVHEKILAMVP